MNSVLFRHDIFGSDKSAFHPEIPFSPPPIDKALKLFAPCFDPFHQFRWNRIKIAFIEFFEKCRIFESIDADVESKGYKSGKFIVVEFDIDVILDSRFILRKVL